MPSLIPGFEYDIFISYRHKDNKGGHWVTEFVDALKTELEATFKEDISIYFDENPYDGLMETHNVDKSLEGKLKCLIFIPIVSQTYCDLNSFAWKHEFCAFNKMAKEDSLGRDIKLVNSNVASRILPIKIHSLDADDIALLETELGGVLRSVEFIYKSAGVNRPLKPNDDRAENLNHTYYRDQINKVANAVKEIIVAIKNPTPAKQFISPFRTAEKKKFDYPVKKRKILAIMGLSLLLAGLVSYAIFYFVTPQKTEKADKWIAVLPFEDLSEKQDQEYFTDGMMVDIINRLSKIGDLHVISRTSAMKYKGAKTSVTEIALELGVTSILEGTVRKSGDRVKISVDLIDAKTEKHLWSEDYDYRDLKDIISVQADVSTRVVEILKAKLTQQEKGSLSKVYTENTEAYKLYLKGRFFWDRRTRESYDSAEMYFKQAIELDPGYALAYSGLADCYTLNQKGMTQIEAVPIAKEYVAKALSLDSTLSEAWTTVAFIQSHFEFDWKGSLAIFEKAIRLNPNYPIAHMYYGNVFFFTGDTKRGIVEAKKALELDPLSSSINAVLGRHYYHDRHYDLAIEQLQKTLIIDPNSLPAKWFLGLSLVQKKLYTQAMDVFAELSIQQPQGLQRGFLLSFAYAMAGDKVRAQKELDSTIKEEGVLRSPYWLGIIATGMGDFDQAMTQFEKGYDLREIWIINLKVNPEVDPLRNDPRFKAFLKKMNLD